MLKRAWRLYEISYAFLYLAVELELVEARIAFWWRPLEIACDHCEPYRQWIGQDYLFLSWLLSLVV
jgi:hypothetical protein